MADGCPWYRAWWHRRHRQFDHAVTWTLIRANAADRYPDDEESAVLLALKEWLQFIQAPGQEHWRCACSDQDLNRDDPC